MSEVAFKPGDVVELVSGSSPMAIAWVEDHYGTMSALCQWAEKTKTGQDMKEKVFALVVLRHHKPTAGTTIRSLRL